MANNVVKDLLLVDVSEPKEQRHSSGETYRQLTFIGMNKQGQWQEYKTYINKSFSGRKMRNLAYWQELISYYLEINHDSFKKYNKEYKEYVLCAGDFNLKGIDLINADSKHWEYRPEQDIDIKNGKGHNRLTCEKLGEQFMRVLDAIEGVKTVGFNKSHQNQFDNLFE